MKGVQLNKLKWLKFLVILLVTLGIALSCTPFVKALKPSVNSLYKWQIEIDLSNHGVGELKSYIGRFSPIWIYRRTPEQIAWLEEYQPTVVVPFISKHSKSMEFNGQYRSIKKEYFVFNEWHLRNKTHLQEGRGWNQCGVLKYIDGPQRVKDGRIFNGIIACSRNFDNFRVDGWGHIYDVAGNASSRYMVPLRVPYYEFNKKGNIVITPFPRLI